MSPIAAGSRTAVFFAFALFLAARVEAAEITGIVTEVHGGASLTLVNWNATYRIRLAEVDAPGWDQKRGKESHAALLHLCALKKATAETIGEDRFGRTYARVRCAGRDVSAQQVRQGFAWVFRRHVAADSPLFQLEEAARTARLGVWQDDDPIPPWEWRKSKREAKRNAPASRE